MHDESVANSAVHPRFQPQFLPNCRIFKGINMSPYLDNVHILNIVLCVYSSVFFLCYWIFIPFNSDSNDGDETRAGDKGAVESGDFTKRGAPTAKIRQVMERSVKICVKIKWVTDTLQNVFQICNQLTCSF